MRSTPLAVAFVLVALPATAHADVAPGPVEYAISGGLILVAVALGAAVLGGLAFLALARRWPERRARALRCFGGAAALTLAGIVIVLATGDFGNRARDRRPRLPPPAVT